MMLPQATKQAPEGESAANDGGETERKKIANRLWINDAGDEVQEDEATGVSYEFLGRTKEGIVHPADGKATAIYFRDLNEPQKNMLAGFGALTLMGNVANTWMIDKSNDHESVADAIAARIALLAEGKWIDRSAGAVGAKLDKDALAEAVTAVAEELYTSGNTKAKEKVDAAGGIEQYKAAARQRIEDSADYVKDLRKVKSVMDKYNELVGKPTKSADDIL